MNNEIENFDKLYATNPQVVKLTSNGSTVTISCDEDSITASADNKLIWNLASMLALHAETRLADMFDDDNGQHHVEVLKVDFNNVALQSDTKWEAI